MKHTQEPWYRDEYGNVRTTAYPRVGGKHERVVLCGFALSTGGTESSDPCNHNDERICDCVNALAGIADPEAFVAKVREAVAAMNRANAAATDGDETAMLNAQDDECVALSSIARMLPQENHNG